MCEEVCQTQEKSAQKLFQEYIRKKPEINTSEIYKTFNLPQRFEKTYLFQGYGIQNKNVNPFYKTINSEYGYYAPNPHTVPTTYFPRSQKFSTNLAKFGMYRNYSLNTVLEKTYY